MPVKLMRAGSWTEMCLETGWEEDASLSSELRPHATLIVEPAETFITMGCISKIARDVCFDFSFV